MRIILFVENNHCGGMDSFFINLINHWPYPEDELTLVYNPQHPGGPVIERAVSRRCFFVAHDVPLNWSVVDGVFLWLPATIRLPLRYFMRIALLPLQIAKLRRIFRKLAPDRLLIVNGAYPGGESCRAAALAWRNSDKPPYLYNIRNFAVPPRRFTAFYENWLDRKVITGARAFVGVSRSCAESLRLRSAFVHSTRIRHIYNGVSLQPSSDDGRTICDIRKKFAIRSGPVCLMLGTYEPRKGHAFLFEAFSKVRAAIPDAHLVVCGDGSQAEMAAVEGLRVTSAACDAIHLAPYLPNGARLIWQADLLLVASQYWESFGWTVIEAMVRAVPVVSTNVGGLSEVVGPNGEAGFTVAPSDVEGYAQHIIKLLQTPDDRRAMGDRARRRVEREFDVVRMVREYADEIRAA